MKIIVNRAYIIELIKNILGKKIVKPEAVRLVDKILFLDDDNFVIDESEHQLIVEALHLINSIEDTSWKHVSDNDLKDILSILETTKGKDSLGLVLKKRK